MVIDPIADLITRIRNAQAVRKAEVRVPASKMKQAIVDILVAEGLLNNARLETEGLVLPELVLNLKYDKVGKPVINNLKRISKPGRRVYAKKDALPRVLFDFGLAIISTSQGVMTNKEARKKSLGGEVLFEIS